MLRTALALTTVLREAGWPQSRMQGVVRDRLQRVLRSAARVPMYQDLYGENHWMSSDRVPGPEVLKDLPVLSRKELSATTPEYRMVPGVPLSRCHIESSSGSSGIPLTVCRSQGERAVQVAKWLRVLLANGYRPRQKVMALVHPNKVDQTDHFLQRMGLFRRLTVDYFQPVADLTGILLKVRPQVLYGNRCHLELMAQELNRRGKRCAGLEMVVVTGEVLHQGSRRFMEGVYGTRLVESYGSTEMGVMAHEVPGRKGLVLCEDRTIFEFLDDDDNPVPPGVPGRVVVTDLTNTVMPLIRFDQGDLAEYRGDVAEQGPGRRVLTKVLGRDDDYGVMPDGSLRTYLDFCRQVARMEEVRQFRLTQLTRSTLKLEMVCAPKDRALVRDRFESFMRTQFPDIVHQTVFVDGIEPDPSGKIRKFVSLVPREDVAMPVTVPGGAGIG